MTINEFNEYNIAGNMSCFDIGQGYGYKLDKEWDDIDEQEIIYIPEYGYEETDFNETIYVERSSAFSKEDFIELVRNYGINDHIEEIARRLFNWCDWQFPTTVIEEGYIDDCFREYLQDNDLIEEE
jgi:hypothetical protein